MALYHRLSEDMKLSQVSCEVIVEKFVDIVKEQLKQKNEVKLVGFGTFKVVRHKARVAHNPRTGQPMKLPARSRVKFKQHDSYNV